MRRQTIYHVVNLVLALPLLAVGVLMAVSEPVFLNPWNDAFFGGLWLVLWPMLLAGTFIPLNSVLALLRMRQAKN